MTSLTNALIIVLSINAILFLGQASVLQINPAANTFYNNTGSILGSFDSGNNTLNDTDPASRLPSSEAGVSPTTGNVFTDAIVAIKSWFLQSTGLTYIFQILGAPYHFIQFIGLPSTFSFAIGTLWYGITLFLILAFIMGRDA